MTRDETGQLLAYDAWGRLVTVNTDGTGGVEITNLYDALNRWIKRNASEFYYTASWQQIEERDAQGVEAQQVWSSVYIDAMVLRDRDSDNDGVMEATDERLYVVHDANFNVTSLIKEDGTWQVIERFIYDAYGTRSVLDANWSFDADNLSDVGFGWGYQGGLHDLIAGMVYFRFRWLDTSLGRWERQDPAGMADGANLLAYELSSPVSVVDPWGLKAKVYGFSGVIAGKHYVGDWLDEFVPPEQRAPDEPWMKSSQTWQIPVFFPLMPFLSRDMLNDEARHKTEHITKGCACKDGRAQTIKVLMLAPKTGGRPKPSGPCCEIEIQSVVSSRDGVPNLGIFDKNHPGVWDDYGPVRVIYPRRDPIGAHGFRHYSDMTSKETIERWMNDPNVDHVLVCHSQGCNIMLAALERACAEAES